MTKNELFLKYGTGKDLNFVKIERELREFDDTEEAKELDKKNELNNISENKD